MSDPIDRQAAIAEFSCCELTPDGGIDANYAIDFLTQMPSAQQWIPCSERLPDEDYCTGANHQYSADVLITAHNANDEETIIDYGHTIDGAWYSDTTDCTVPSDWKVIAWMPLPEPYKGEQK